MIRERFNGGESELLQSRGHLAAWLAHASVEVLPRTLARIPHIDNLLPARTRTYLAHIEGTEINDMVAAAKRLNDAGLTPMPHFPARLIRSQGEFRDWIARYRDEAGVSEALVLGGGVKDARGPYESSMQLLETGLFDKMGFKRLHVAGHPEGNSDIDPDGSGRIATEALRWKHAFSERTEVQMAIVTQFVFEAAPVVRWARAIREAGVSLPIHIGLAGPAKLATLIKYAVTCGVGPSLKVLQRRARDLTRLARPFEPTDIASELATARAVHKDLQIEALHFFPLGGILPFIEWYDFHRSSAASEAVDPRSAHAASTPC